MFGTLISVAAFVIPLAVVVAYVVIRERRHPVDHPPRNDGQGWGNLWPRS
jgi:hypothetical protein